MKIILVCLFFTFAAMSGMAQKMSETGQPYEKIQTGPGPEDMALDTVTASPRILISCASRRKNEAPFNEIMSYDVSTGNVRTLPRKNHPDSISFHPHGIDMGFLNGRNILLVVNHEENINRHSILRYLITENELVYDTVFINKNYIISPNDVLAGLNGEFWFSNDASSRHSAMEMLFKVKGGSIGYCDGKSDWKFVSKKYAYPNGLMRVGTWLFISTTRQNKIFKGQLNDDGSVDRRNTLLWAKATGWDNFSYYDEKLLYCTAHTQPIKFVGHMKDSLKKSPVAVYEINVDTPGQKLVYYTDGDEISAGSTAIRYRGFMYICQVFDPFILKVKLAS